MKKIIFPVVFVGLVVALWFGYSSTKTAHAAYGIYYGTDPVVAQSTYRFNPMIVQPYNINLYGGYTGKKVCYLSVTEFFGTPAELQNLGIASSTIGFNTTWNTYRMNAADINWQNHLIKEEKKLKSIGCSGLFLDTIWDDSQKVAVVSMISKLRSNWKSGFFVANNAHSIKNEVRRYVDVYMFENFFAPGSTPSDVAWYTAQVGEYKTLASKYGKKLYAISYGDPFADAPWGEQVRAQAVAGGLETIFLNRDVTQIFGYINLANQQIVK